MKIEAWHAPEEKRRRKLVRTDYYGPNGGDIEGQIETANEEIGECSLLVDGEPEPKTFSFGPRGFKIVPRW